MQTYELNSHPAFMPGEVTGVSVRWSVLPKGKLMLRYRVDGAAELTIPDFRGRGRGLDLWKNTCMELFLYDGKGRYREFNFSPSGQWALYGFNGYRNGREDIEPLRTPEITGAMGESVYMMTVFLSVRELEGAESAALSVVAFEDGGRPSYWGMVHNKMEPDFHDPACFRIALGAAKGA